VNDNGETLDSHGQWTNDLLRMCGITDDEIAELPPDVTEGMLSVAAIVRMAERMTAMESYIRAKIEEKRKRNVTGIIIPGRSN